MGMCFILRKRQFLPPCNDASYGGTQLAAMTLIAIAYFIWFIAGFLTGLTAFGGNLVAVPLVLCLVAPKEAILQGYVAGAAMCLFLSAVYFRHILWKEILALAAFSLPGIPLGILFYRHIAVRYIFLLAGLVLIVFLAWHWLQKRLKRGGRAAGKFWAAPLGIATGFLNAAIGMGGPPIAVYAFIRHWQPGEALASISFCALVSMAFIVPLQLAGNAVPLDILRHSLWSGFFAGAGILLSVPVARHIDAVLFRKLLLGMIAFSACLLIIRYMNMNI